MKSVLCRRFSLRFLIISMTSKKKPKNVFKSTKNKKILKNGNIMIFFKTRKIKKVSVQFSSGF